MLVKEIMNEAIAIDSDISIKEAAKIMTDRNIGSLIIVQGEKILGIITEKDITKNIANSTKKVSSVMTKQITTIDPNENIEEAAIIMSKNKIKHMPVVNKNSKLLGIITSTDILKHSEDLDDDFLFD